MTEKSGVDVEKRSVEKKENSSMVMATFIKYAAYLIIFFGVLWLLIQYVFPMF